MRPGPFPILLLSTITPLLAALSLVDNEFGGGDEREKLERYVDSLDWYCDSQIEQIAALIPTEEVEHLRREHYAWRLHRDFHCADVARESSDRLAELQCLADATSQYFDRREAEIGELEAKLAQSERSK